MIRQEMADQLNSAQSAERKQIIDYYQDMTGLSEQHLYRIAKDNGFASGKSRRGGKGDLKTGFLKD